MQELSPGGSKKRPDIQDPSSVLLPSVCCGFFDHSCNFLWPGYVDRVTGAGDFDLVAVGAHGIPSVRGRG
jgi:hypothetical protein